MTILLAAFIQSAPRDTSAQIRNEEYWFVSDSEKAVYFIDIGTIKNVGTNREYWLRYILSVTDKYGAVYGMQKISSDCESETNLTMYQVSYNASGQIIRSADPKEYPKPVIPGSVNERIHHFACISPDERLKAGYFKVGSKDQAAQVAMDLFMLARRPAPASR
jgi:hypothetical protein